MISGFREECEVWVIFPVFRQSPMDSGVWICRKFDDLGGRNAEGISAVPRQPQSLFS
jgi:hypothetical protein